MKLDDAQQDLAIVCYREALMSIAARTPTIIDDAGNLRVEIITEAKAIARECVGRAKLIREKSEL